MIRIRVAGIVLFATFSICFADLHGLTEPSDRDWVRNVVKLVLAHISQITDRARQTTRCLLQTRDATFCIRHESAGGFILGNVGGSSNEIRVWVWVASTEQSGGEAEEGSKLRVPYLGKGGVGVDIDRDGRYLVTK